MTQGEYNKMLQDLQEIEAQLGYKILTAFEEHDKSGTIVRAGFTGPPDNYPIMWQYRPFTDHTEYAVHQSRYDHIFYMDWTR